MEMVETKTAKEKTADDVLEMVSARIRRWARCSNYGEQAPWTGEYVNYITKKGKKKKRKKMLANILVQRANKDTGEEATLLAIKIANRTLGYMPWDTSRDGKAQVETCLENLKTEKETLHALYKEVCKQLPNGRTANTGTDLVEVA